MIARTTQQAPCRPTFPLLRRGLALVALVGLSMCNLTHIDVSVGGKTSIPQGSVLTMLLGGLAFSGFDKVDFTQEFQNQGVTKGDVNSVRLKSFDLQIDAPAGGNFDFIQSLAFFAEADGASKIQIASMSTIPKGMKQLTLVVDANAELEPYVVAPSMRITSQVQGMAPTSDTTVSAAIVLDVNVHIPGC